MPGAREAEPGHREAELNRREAELRQREADLAPSIGGDSSDRQTDLNTMDRPRPAPRPGYGSVSRQGYGSTHRARREKEAAAAYSSSGSDVEDTPLNRENYNRSPENYNDHYSRSRDDGVYDHQRTNGSSHLGR